MSEWSRSALIDKLQASNTLFGLCSPDAFTYALYCLEPYMLLSEWVFGSEALALYWKTDLDSWIGMMTAGRPGQTPQTRLKLILPHLLWK